MEYRQLYMQLLWLELPAEAGSPGADRRLLAVAAVAPAAVDVTVAAATCKEGASIILPRAASLLPAVVAVANIGAIMTSCVEWMHSSTGQREYY